MYRVFRQVNQRFLPVVQRIIRSSSLLQPAAPSSSSLRGSPLLLINPKV